MTRKSFLIGLISSLPALSVCKKLQRLKLPNTEEMYTALLNGWCSRNSCFLTTYPYYYTSTNILVYVAALTSLSADPVVAVTVKVKSVKSTADALQKLWSLVGTGKLSVGMEK